MRNWKEITLIELLIINTKVREVAGCNTCLPRKLKYTKVSVQPERFKLKKHLRNGHHLKESYSLYTYSILNQVKQLYQRLNMDFKILKIEN